MFRQLGKALSNPANHAKILCLENATPVREYRSPRMRSPMSLAYTTGVDIQRHWGQIVGLLIGTWAIVQGAAAREWTIRPRRSSTEPFKFTPRWYHRVVMVSMGTIVAVVSLRSFLN